MNLRQAKDKARPLQLYHGNYIAKQHFTKQKFPDDINISGRIKLYDSTAFRATEQESAEMDLTVNKDKAKYMIKTCGVSDSK